jgi:hypothetical protein
METTVNSLTCRACNHPPAFDPAPPGGATTGIRATPYGSCWGVPRCSLLSSSASVRTRPRRHRRLDKSRAGSTPRAAASLAQVFAIAVPTGVVIGLVATQRWLTRHRRACGGCGLGRLAVPTVIGVQFGPRRRHKRHVGRVSALPPLAYLAGAAAVAMVGSEASTVLAARAALFGRW